MVSSCRHDDQDICSCRVILVHLMFSICLSKVNAEEQISKSWITLQPATCDEIILNGESQIIQGMDIKIDLNINVWILLS